LLPTRPTTKLVGYLLLFSVLPATIRTWTSSPPSQTEVAPQCDNMNDRITADNTLKFSP